MTIATTSSRARQSLVQHAPSLALSLAGTAVVLLALGPLGWRAGWWHYRFGLLTLMPWAAYFGVAALVVSAVTISLGRSRVGARGIVVAVGAFAVGALIAYVPWHYNAMRQTVPPVNDITTDSENPPTYAAVMSLRAAEGANPVTYQGPKFADQQKRAYPDIAPMILELPPAAAFARALAAAQQMGWTIVAADQAGSRQARGAAGTASPTTLSFVLPGCALAAASTCARRRGRGGATSASMPHACALTFPLCAKPRAARASSLSFPYRPPR